MRLPPHAPWNDPKVAEGLHQGRPAVADDAAVAAGMAYYDACADKAHDPEAVSPDRVPRVLALLDSVALRDRTILSVGCGNGAAERRVAEATGAQILGIDTSSASIRLANEARLVSGVRFVAQDIYDDTFDAVFDGVWFLDSLEHVQDPEQALHFAVARLAPGGHLLLTFPHPDVRRAVGLDSQPIDHVLDLDWLAVLLSSLGLVEVLAQGHDVFRPGTPMYWDCLWVRP